MSGNSKTIYMKLNQNSISARIYRWFYMKTEMPSNLCPYFWKLVIAYAMLIPVLTVTLLYEILYIGSRNKPADSQGERLFYGFMAWAVLVLVTSALSLVTLFWYTPAENSWLWNVMATGVATWFGALILGIAMLYKYFLEKRDEAKWKRVKNNYDENGNWIPYEDRLTGKRPNIILEFIKAKYNKYCPKIDWN